MTSRAGILVLLGAVVAAAGCGGGGASPSGSGGPTGLVVVTSAGSALTDGSDDVTPTLDLRVSAGRALGPAEVDVRLDGRVLAVRDAGGAAVASTAPMALGSAHHLDLDVAGSARQIAFRVVDATAAMAALHHDTRDGTVLDLAFSLAPPRAAVEAALPRGGAPSWLDDRHLRAAWATAPGGSLRLPATMATARGSHLAGDLALDLGPVATSALRAAMVPAPPTGLARSALVVGFSVATPASRAAVAAHADQMSFDSPTGVTVAGDGSLAGTPDAPTVAVAAERGLPVWPLVQNRGFDSATVDALLHDQDAVAHFTAAATRLARDGGFAGLHLDAENVPPDDQALLSALVSRLAAALHAEGRRLAVAVVPHKPDHLNYYSGAYDLAAIGRAADLVTVMAYEQHGASTAPGAVAGLDWVGTVLDGTVPAVGASRALLGLPVYSRSWGPGGDIADSFPSSVSSALEAPGARVDADFAAAALLVHGADGTYTALVDAPSVLALAAQQGRRRMAGIALWRLGLEDPALWTALPAHAPRL